MLTDKGTESYARTIADLHKRLEHCASRLELAAKEKQEAVEQVQIEEAMKWKDALHKALAQVEAARKEEREHIFPILEQRSYTQAHIDTADRKIKLYRHIRILESSWQVLKSGKEEE